MSIYIVKWWPNQDYHKLTYSLFFASKTLKKFETYDNSIGNDASYYILELSVFTTENTTLCLTSLHGHAMVS